jgi:carboxypeptidase family protein
MAGLFAGVIFGHPALLYGQSKKASITGRVTASGGSVPVPGARISVVNLHRSTVTDSVGRFAFNSLQPGRYLLEASLIGFAPLNAIVVVAENERKDVEFRTDSAGALLPTIYVEGEAQPELVRPMTKFERRMAGGHGRFLTRDAILERNPFKIMDMIRFLPGVRTNCYGTSCQVRLNNDPSGCPPAVFIDDQRTSVSVLESTPPGDIEGVEIYRGPSETPPELNNELARCGGAIAVWTRRGLSR